MADVTIFPYQEYWIESDTHVYVAKQRLRWRWSKPAELTVNAPVEFRIKGRKIWIRDELEKVRKMSLVKKILKRRQE